MSYTTNTSLTQSSRLYLKLKMCAWIMRFQLRSPFRAPQSIFLLVRSCLLRTRPQVFQIVDEPIQTFEIKGQTTPHAIKQQQHTSVLSYSTHSLTQWQLRHIHILILYTHRHTDRQKSIVLLAIWTLKLKLKQYRLRDDNRKGGKEEGYFYCFTSATPSILYCSHFLCGEKRKRGREAGECYFYI